MKRSFVAIVMAIGALAGTEAETMFAGDATPAAGVAESIETANSARRPDGVITGDDLLSPAVLPLLIDVFENGGAGYLGTEFSAFLVVDDAGTYRTVAWPKSNEWQAARFHGVVPQGAIAIVHTHPTGSPRPSVADAATARKTALAVVVLTARDIFMATPDGSSLAVLRGTFWADAR